MPQTCFCHYRDYIPKQTPQQTNDHCLTVLSHSPSSHSISNQEELERVKKDIEEQKRRKKDLEQEAQRTNIVLQSIKDALVEMLLKLQEVDEMTAEIQARRRAAKPLSVPLPDLVSGNISTEQIVKMLEEKVKVGMIASGQLGDGVDSGLSEDEEEVVEIVKPVEPPKELTEAMERVKSPSITSFAIDEKPSAYPQVYSSLITGRSTGLVSASPGAGGGEPFSTRREFMSTQLYSLFRRRFRRGSRCSQQILPQASSESHSGCQVTTEVQATSGNETKIKGCGSSGLKLSSRKRAASLTSFCVIHSRSASLTVH